MRERWQVYVHNIGSVAAGDTITGIPFQTDLDAPFILRGRTFTIGNPTGVLPNAIFTSRFADSVGNYRSTELIPSNFDTGVGPAPQPVYPQIFYPAGSQITTDVSNVGTQPGNLTVLYFGVKLWGDDAAWPTYPDKCSQFDFSYTLYVPNVTPTFSQTNIIKAIAGDADYVIRGGYFGPTQQAGSAFPPQYFTNLTMVFKDFNQQAFMNAGVDVKWLFPGAVNGLNTGQFNNAIPGLVVPEIYLRANQQFLIDIVRSDGAVTSPGVAVTQDCQLVLRGSKVYTR